MLFYRFLAWAAIGAVVALFLVVMLLYQFTGETSATSFANTMVATANVLQACGINTITTTVTFGGTSGVYPGVRSTYNTIVFTETGNKATNILVASTNWVFSANVAQLGFVGTNTVYSATGSPDVGNSIPLFSNTKDTAIVLPSGSSNTVYFAVNVPNGQSANTYTQNIIAQTSC